MKLPKAFHLYHVEPSVVIFGIPLVYEGNTIAQGFKKEKENEFFFSFLNPWAAGESPRRFSGTKMTRNLATPPIQKFLEVSEPSFKKVLTSPVTHP